MSYLSAVPAYERDYKNKKEVQADWDAGKDFLAQDMLTSRYVNKSNLPAGVTLNIRYAQLRKVHVIRSKK